MPMNNLLPMQDNMPSSSEENNCDSPYSPASDDFSVNNLYNPSTLLDPKLEVLDSNTPLFFMTPQQTPTRELQPSFMSPTFSQSVTNFTQKNVSYLEYMNGSDDNSIEQSVTSPQSDRQCHIQDISDKGLQIHVLGVPQTGAKSRVETQIKLCLQLVTDKGEKVPLWSHLRLPEYMVAKEKLKTKNARNPPDQMNILEKGVLNLEATVVCASEIPKKVLTCLGCVQRERKRSQRKKENRHAKANSNAAAPQVEDSNKPMDLDDEKTMQLEQRKILLFNCSEIVDFSSGDTILPTRITCYCRHHNEKVGFCIYFVMKDCTDAIIATGMSPPIMITDDHKSSKTKVGVGRKRPRAEYDRRNSTTANNPINSTKSKASERRASSTGTNDQSTPPSLSIIPSSEPTGGLSSPVSIIPTQNSSLIASISSQQSTIKQEKNNNSRQRIQVQPFGFNPSSSPASPISPMSPIIPITTNLHNTSNPQNTSSQPYQQLDQSTNLATSGPQVNFPVVSHSAAMMNLSMAPTSLNNMNPIYQAAQLHQNLGAHNRYNISAAHHGGGPMRLHASHHSNQILRRPFYNTSGNAIYQNGTISGYPIPRMSRLIPSEGPTYGGIEGLTCVFGESPAIPTQYWSPNTLVCILPPAPTPGAVVVSFKEYPINLIENPEEVVLFSYTDDSDRALMELALQVVGMKMTGKIEDARNIAMRIVGGNDNNSNSGNSNGNGSMNGMHNHLASFARQAGENNFEAHIITTISLLDVLETEHDSISLQNRQQHTMLHIAAMLGYTRLCSVLIDRDIDLNLQDKYGFTALHYAAWTGREEIVRILITAGSGDIIPNFNDQYAIDLAISRNFDDIVAIINDHRLHDSGVSLSSSSSEQSSLYGSDDDLDDSEDESGEKWNEQTEESINDKQNQETTPNISWVDSATANDLLLNKSEEDDGIVNAEVVDKKNIKQPFSEMATDLASASTIWLQKTFAHMHMPTIGKPSQINIPLPYLKMPNLQMPNLQMPYLQHFSSPKFSTMNFGTNLSIPRPSMPSMPSLNMNIEFPTLPMVTFPAIIPSGFTSFVRDEKNMANGGDMSEMNTAQYYKNKWLRQGQPDQQREQSSKEVGQGFGRFGYSWPFYGSQPIVPMYHHEPEEPRAPSPSPPASISRVSRKVGYDLSSLNEEQIARVEHHDEKYKRLKKDRMLYLFWVPVFFVMIALAVMKYSTIGITELTLLIRNVVYNIVVLRIMPKIVSSSTVSSSEQVHAYPEQHLHVYYCLCSEFILVIGNNKLSRRQNDFSLLFRSKEPDNLDARLEKLPRRTTDKAYIVSNGKRVYKLNAVEAPNPVILKRPDGYEKQYRLNCPRCNLFLAYEVTEERKKGPHTYIVEGSLTENQGVVPHGAIPED
ncbi:2979_t:CDS:10 [Funneliformis geosporum]|nr:2979_t:CDS:10 [Funneliformis geosporum]